MAEALLDNPTSHITLIDKNFSEYSAHRNFEKCHKIEMNMNDQKSLDSLIAQENFDTIFHFAANSDIQQSSKSSDYDLENTFLTTYSLLQALHKNRPCNLVFSSTSAVYGSGSNKFSEDEECLPMSSYGWMKLASEKILKKSFLDGYLQKLLILRFPNVTGKYQTHGVVFDLLNKLKKNPSLLEVLGNGTQTKPYVLANELASCILQLLDKEIDPYLTVNLTPIDLVSVKEIVDNIRRITSLQFSVEFGSEPFGWKGDVSNYSLDGSKLLNFLGTSPFSSSQDAVQKSIEWYWKYLNGG